MWLGCAGRGSWNWLGVGEQKGLLAQQRRCSGFREIVLVRCIVLRLARCLNLSTTLVFFFAAQISATVLHHVCISTGSQQLRILNIALLTFIVLLPCSRATSHKEGSCFHKTNKSVQSCESLLPAFTSLFLDSTFIPPFIPPPSLFCALFDSLGFRISLTDFLHANAGTREYLLTDFSCTAQLIFTDSQRT